MTLTVEDQSRLQRWWAESRARGVLPSDMEIVQGRLIRQVGRSQLPDAGEVYVKLMAFPRLKDRIRYLFRTLPARHACRRNQHLPMVRRTSSLPIGRLTFWWPRTTRSTKP